MKISLLSLLFLGLTGCVVYQEPNPYNYQRTEFYAPANSTLIYSEHYSYPQYNNINVYPNRHPHGRPYYYKNPNNRYDRYDRGPRRHYEYKDSPDVIIKVK